jgi:hypothetical protein
MKKVLCSVGLLVCVLVLTSFHEKSNAAGVFFGPRVVAKVSLKSGMPVAPTTIFTPPQTGMYRVSSYMTMTTASSDLTGFWGLGFGWTDDAGVEEVFLMGAQDNRTPPWAWGNLASGNGAPPVGPFSFEAVGGTPVTYWVTPPSDTNGGTYELFLVVERLE